MVSRLLLIYAVVELAVIFALVSTIGWGWTLLVLLATFVLGWGIVAQWRVRTSSAGSANCAPG